MGPTVVSSGSPEVMGVAAVTAGSGSRASAESNFRELDDVFLQTQTRIWLGEVLQTRLHEQTNISDLLVDGELLFEVSKVIWKMLLTKKMELRHIEAYKYEPFASRKSGGRYMPYSNVASFLKICNLMGLSGIDLFSPSDVVEKRNTRKVCMCIRSLSKKARTKHLEIPDFDIVTYTVAMPTDMVGYIRRSIELSQWSPISSGSPSSSESSRPKNRQKRSSSTSARNYDSYSDESDEEESNLTVLKSCSSFPSSSTPSQMNFDLDNTLEVSLNSYNSESNPFQLDSNEPEKFGAALDQFEPSYSNESVGSVCLQHDDQPEIMSKSSSKAPEIHIKVEANLKGENRSSHGNNKLDAYLGMDMTNQVPTVSNAADAKILKKNRSAPQLAATDMDLHCTRSILEREGGTCSASPGAYSHDLFQITFNDEFKRLSEIDLLEVSSNSSINSVSSMVYNCGYDELPNVEDDIENPEESEMLNQKDSNYQDSEMLNQKDCPLTEKNKIGYSSLEKNEKLLEDITPDTDMTEFETGVAHTNVSTSLRLSSNTDLDFPCYKEDSVASVLLNGVHDEVKFLLKDSESSKNINLDLLESSMLNQSHLPLDFDIWDQKDQSRLKESGGIRCSNASTMRKGIAGVPCQGIGSFADHCKGQSASHIELVSKVMEDPNRYFHTCSSTEDIGYGDLRFVPRTINRGDTEAPNISSACSDIQKNETTPVIGSKYEFDPPTVTLCSITKCMADEHIPPSLAEVDNSTIKVCKSPELANEPQVESSDGVKDCNFPAPERKPQGRALLKNLLKGTAVAGTLFFLMQMRRSIKEEGTGQPQTQSKERRKERQKLPLNNRQRVDKKDSLYPAEKLKF